MKRIFVFGNPDLMFDSLPLRILDKLKKQFPDITFEVLDPNEEWDPPKNLIVIDTVFGIDHPKIVSRRDCLSGYPKISLHDFDAGTHILYLKKLGKIKKIKIIGIPPTISEEEAYKAVSSILRSSRL